jgi:predicted secreted protein
MMKSTYFVVLSLLTLAMSTGLSASQGADAVTASLQASASQQILQDEIRVVFSQEKRGSTAAEVNRALAQALEQARASVKDLTGFKLSSGSFRTSPSYNKEGKADGWQGRAELVLTSNDLAAAEGAAGLLATKLAVSNMQFSLSAPKRRQKEQKLLTEVAQAFRDRAQAAAAAFGFERYQILSLDFGGPGGSGSGPMLMRSAAPMSAPAADMIKFSFEPSFVQVSIDVSGKVKFD